MKRIRILLAEGHTLVSDGFRKLLEPEFEVVGTVGGGRALLKAADELKPDLVLVDVGMPLLNAGCSGAVEEANAAAETGFPYHES